MCGQHPAVVESNEAISRTDSQLARSHVVNSNGGHGASTVDDDVITTVGKRAPAFDAQVEPAYSSIFTTRHERLALTWYSYYLQKHVTSSRLTCKQIQDERMKGKYLVNHSSMTIKRMKIVLVHCVNVVQI